MIYGIAHSSVPQKTVVVFETAILAVGVWLLNFGGLELLSSLLKLNRDLATPGRRLLLSAGCIARYLRMKFTVLCLLKRAMGWEEAFSIPMAFALYYIGFSLFAGPVAGKIGEAAFVGTGLPTIGSVLNTGFALARHS
jgi:hypothetical protein